METKLGLLIAADLIPPPLLLFFPYDCLICPSFVFAKAGDMVECVVTDPNYYW